MIEIRESKTADTRSCDWSKVTREQLRASSEQHIRDVRLGLNYFRRMLRHVAVVHDYDKLMDIDGFHRDFIEGTDGFTEKEWYQRHIKLNRHHLLQAGGVPNDVNLVDVLDMIVDCVMAGMARTGEVYPLDIKPEVLKAAFDNTAELLKNNVTVVKEE